MTFSALVFDMEGLLGDSEPVWHEVEIDLIESFGYLYADKVRDMGIGMRVDEFAAILQRYYPRVGESPAAIESAITERLLSLPAERIRSRPGAEEIVRYAAARDISRAIASSSSQVVIEHFVGLMGWEEQIPNRYSAEFMARGKPAPDIYLHAAEQLGVAPEHCLALEDSRTGTLSALAAGMTCFTVPDLSHSRLEDFAEVNDKVFGSLFDVMDAIKSEGLFE